MLWTCFDVHSRQQGYWLPVTLSVAVTNLKIAKHCTILDQPTVAGSLDVQIACMLSYIEMKNLGLVTKVTQQKT